MSVGKSRFALTLAFALWAAAVAWGLRSISEYSSQAGERVDENQTEWVRLKVLPPANGRARLVSFLHPKCPCSRATVRELDRLLGRAGARAPEVYAVFVRPPNWSDKDVQSDLWKKAAGVRGVRLLIDDGSEAKRIGALTSGHVFLFGADGKLAFQGGITPARGHEGDSAGADAILALLRGRAPTMSRSNIFGCDLFSKSDPKRVAAAEGL